MQHSKGPEEGTDFPGTGVMYDCEPPNVGAGSPTWVLWGKKKKKNSTCS